MNASVLDMRRPSVQDLAILLPENHTEGLSSGQAKEFFRASPAVTIGPWLWNVFDGFGQPTNEPFVPVLIGGDSPYMNYTINILARKKHLIVPTVEQSFYIAKFLVNTQEPEYHFDTVAIMHEPVRCGVDVCSKSFAVFGNKEVCGVMGGPGVAWKKGTRFAFVLR